jgi:hypothetical protein
MRLARRVAVCAFRSLCGFYSLRVTPSFRIRWRFSRPFVGFEWDFPDQPTRAYSSSSFTSPRSAFAFSIIFSCSCCGTVS